MRLSSWAFMLCSLKHYHHPIVCRDSMETKCYQVRPKADFLRVTVVWDTRSHVLGILPFSVNKRRKVCGSRVLHGKLVYNFGHWKNEIMCWNWSHTWKTSGGKAEAREHWEHAQHYLSPRTGFCHERTTILANCTLYLWMRGQWWILFYFKYRNIFDMVSVVSS